ncbi:unnamed protein product [Paramecium sonneborni]|uniref:Uncharacterized protein n=1 Tax=Paramecium sonneborni TaxID=65129 RepID=A0A8S1RVU6_9CILI|nr:unnamed protein product [Paramecium sonneborni]
MSLKNIIYKPFVLSIKFMRTIVYRLQFNPILLYFKTNSKYFETEIGIYAYLQIIKFVINRQSLQVVNKVAFISEICRTVNKPSDFPTAFPKNF